MDKVGFELSPWSTHGRLATKGKSAKDINAEALANFEKEMAKLKSFFKKHGIYALIYTNSDLTKRLRFSRIFRRILSRVCLRNNSVFISLPNSSNRSWSRAYL